MNDDAKPVDAKNDVASALHTPEVRASLDRYWVSNVRIMATLTIAWLIFGVGFGVLLADTLNRFKLPGTGYPLGFWFAQQGSIIAFVLIILIYCALMNKLDAKHHAELVALRKRKRGEG